MALLPPKGTQISLAYDNIGQISQAYDDTGRKVHQTADIASVDQQCAVCDNQHALQTKLCVLMQQAAQLHKTCPWSHGTGFLNT